MPYDDHYYYLYILIAIISLSSLSFRLLAFWLCEMHGYMGGSEDSTKSPFPFPSRPMNPFAKHDLFPDGQWNKN